MKYKVEFEVESDGEWEDSTHYGFKRLIVDPKVAHGLVRVPNDAKIEKIEPPVPIGSVYRSSRPSRAYVWVKTHAGWVSVSLVTGHVGYTSVFDDDAWRNPGHDEEAW